jgi:archaellum component FlaC
MYLEEKLRALEERILALEHGGGSELKGRLQELDERNGKLTKRLTAAEAKLEEFSTGDTDEALGERVDQCESTCHDLLNNDDTLRDRCDSFERKLSAVNKQMEGLLEQLAELDGRHTPTKDHGVYESRLRQAETDLHGIRGLRSEFTDRLGEFERSIGKQRSRCDEFDEVIKSLKGKIGGLDLSSVQNRLGTVESSLDPLRQLGGKLDTLANEVRRRVDDVSSSVRDVDLKWTTLDRESLPGRLRQVEEKLANTDGHQRVSTLSHRIEAIERDATDTRKEVAWLRDRPSSLPLDQWARGLASLAAMLAIGAIVLWWWPSETITARRFRLVNRDNQLVGEWLNHQGGGGGQFDLLDGAGRRRLSLASSAGGSVVALSDENGLDRARFAAETGGGAGMVALDPAGQERLWAGVRETSAVQMMDSLGQVRGSWSLESAGAELAFLDAQRRPSVRLTSTPFDNGLRVYDEAGRLRVGTGMTTGGAAVNLFDVNEDRRIVLSTGTDASALAFLGHNEMQRTTLGMTAKDESILNLHDSGGRQRILLIASEENAKVEVLDQNTNVVFQGP